MLTIFRFNGTLWALKNAIQDAALDSIILPLLALVAVKSKQETRRGLLSYLAICYSGFIVNNPCERSHSMTSPLQGAK